VRYFNFFWENEPYPSRAWIFFKGESFSGQWKWVFFFVTCLLISGEMLFIPVRLRVTYLKSVNKDLKSLYNFDPYIQIQHCEEKSFWCTGLEVCWILAAPWHCNE